MYLTLCLLQDIIVDTGRTEAFAIANIKTSLAVPIFASGSVTPSCVLCFYSLVRTDCVPFVLKFLEQALRSLWLGLERLHPHESIGKDLWKDVAPADLGEMAADLEMQKAFYQKKRPYDAISSKQVSYTTHFHLISPRNLLSSDKCDGFDSRTIIKRRQVYQTTPMNWTYQIICSHYLLLLESLH
jgi:hypothetical protein